MYIFDLVSNRISTQPVEVGTVACSVFTWYAAASTSTSNQMGYSADSVTLAERLMRSDLVVRYRFDGGPWTMAKHLTSIDYKGYSPGIVQYIYEAWASEFYEGPTITFVREGGFNGVVVDPAPYPIVAAVNPANSYDGVEQGNAPASGTLEFQVIDPDTGATLFNAAQTFEIKPFPPAIPGDPTYQINKGVAVRGGLRPIGAEFPGTGPGAFYELTDYELSTQDCDDASYTEQRATAITGVATVQAVAPAVGGSVTVLEELFGTSGALLGTTSTGALSAWATTSDPNTFWNLVSDANDATFVQGSTYSEGSNAHIATFDETSFAAISVEVDLKVSASISTATFPLGDEVVNVDVYDAADSGNKYVSIGLFLRNEDDTSVSVRARAEIYFYVDSSTEVYDFAFYTVPAGTVSLRLETTGTSITAYANDTSFLTVTTALHTAFDASGIAISHSLVDNVPGVTLRTSAVRVDNLRVSALT
jgi:hypothetical protein